MGFHPDLLARRFASGLALAAWLVAASLPIAWAAGPLPSAPPCNVRIDPQEVLKLLNAARASGRSCGSTRMPPAPPLAWDANLVVAAASHAEDMARRGYFDHDSPEGRAAGQRVRAAGYRWTSVGENIALGETSAAAAVQGWLGSPAHCENIMAADFADVGLACAQGATANRAMHWTMVFGRKR